MMSFRTCVLVLFAGLALLLTGCPDYSHLREVPDYQNMTDSGVEPDLESESNE